MIPERPVIPGRPVIPDRPVIPGHPVIPASSLSSGQDGTCMGRNPPSFPERRQCTARGPAFKDISPLPYRARTELVGNRFTCSRCPCTYSSKGGLTEHVRHIHDNASRYRCETCGKGFSIRSHYYDHIAAHTGVKRYCSVCLKEFTSTRSLKGHMLHFHPAEIAHE